MAHRCITYGVGVQYVRQLTDKADGAVESGFGNWVETIVCGFPAIGGGEMVYGRDIDRNPVPVVDWNLLVKQSLAKRQATLPSDWLKSDPPAVTLLVNAERWALVGLLNQQPAKFGKFLLAIKHGDSDLTAIEKVYGWSEKELDRQWRAYVLKPGKKKPAS